MKTYSDELKASIVVKMLPPNPINVPTLAREFGIPRDTLYGWRRQAGCDLQKWVQISTEVDANGLELTEVDANESGNTTAFEERDGLQKSPRQPIKVDATGAKNNRHRV